MPILFCRSCVKHRTHFLRTQNFSQLHVQARSAAISSVSVCYLFYEPVDEKIKTWTLRFPAKENPVKYGEGIVRSVNRVGCTMTSKRSID